MLGGSTASLVTGGAFARVGRASLVLALLAPIPTLMLSDPFCWWAGRLWGPAAAQYLGGRGPRAQKRMARAVRAIERYDSLAVVAAPFLPIPSALIYAAAGWGEMRLRRFLVLDILGTLLWCGLFVGLGWGIGRSAVNVAHKISHYSLIVTIAIVVIVFVVAFRRAWTEGDPGGAPVGAPPSGPDPEG